MKKFTLTLAIALCLGLFTSCTVDELDQPESFSSKMSSTTTQFNNTNKNSINVSLDSLSPMKDGDDVGFEIDPPKPYPKPE